MTNSTVAIGVRESGGPTVFAELPFRDLFGTHGVRFASDGASRQTPAIDSMGFSIPLQDAELCLAESGTFQQFSQSIPVRLSAPLRPCSTRISGTCSVNFGGTIFC